jgi:acyl-CoA thioesterase-1
MSRYLVSLVICLFINLSLPHASAGENSQLQQQSILIMGDSISAGFGIDTEDGWVALLENKLNSLNTLYDIINASISGETTSGGANRIQKLLEQHHPKIVIIELGGNDGLRGLPASLMKQNFDHMIVQSKRAGANVFLLAMQIPPNYGLGYSKLFARQYQQLADKHEITLVPFFLEDIATKEGMMQNDGIHPTTKAQPFMMEAVWNVLQHAVQ